ncbi:hypothetical protein [Spongiactinospora sp. 9N601]|uniref:hypothetical protein n=1 Tax=Spongiactinospora sp. 9N601 TaxID=3375149 RepID=UPI0037A78C17
MNVVLARNKWTAEMLLCRIAQRHRQLGYGTMAVRREKVSRWINGTCAPDATTQRAMADVLGVEQCQVDSRGWPAWLLCATDDDRIVMESPWTPAGSVEVLEDVGGRVDRREFLIVGNGALAAFAAQWVTASQAGASLIGRRVGHDVVALLDQRLAALRHLDDQVGAGEVYSTATAELRLITGLLRRASYSDTVGRALYGCAAEASRLAGWCAYDAGHHAAAERHFIAALRSAAGAGDDDLGAITLAFWANLRYAAVADGRGALDLLNGAFSARVRMTSPRAVTLLHVRRARAYSVLGESVAAYGAIDDALNAYDRAGLVDDDLPQMYWVTAGELHQAAGSAALALGEPRRALDHFDAAIAAEDPYDPAKETRGAVIYLARRAEAYLALGDLDAAVATAAEVVKLMGGIDSARSTATLKGLRGQLNAYRNVPVVADFLGGTA